MPKKYYKAEEIINILRQVEILTSQGKTAQMADRGVGISEQTYYRWQKEYGGMRTDQAQRLRELEQEGGSEQYLNVPQVPNLRDAVHRQVVSIGKPQTTGE